jgi:hypothetical protein
MPLEHEKITNKISCSGYCAKCGREHYLFQGTAYAYCLELIRTLEREKRIDFDVSPENCNPAFSTDYLFGNALGQMFGILVCNDKYGQEVVLKAFSGQYNGVWDIKGWIPTLFNAEEFDRISRDVDKEIKSLGKQIDELPGDSPERSGLIRHRKELSQDLMKEIHALYRLKNFNGDESSLFHAFIEDRGIPTGTGDCCGPKLLNYAAENSLTPAGIAEFYFGRTNRSGTKRHKEFYVSCENKCRPILGFLLCGIDGGRL